MKAVNNQHQLQLKEEVHAYNGEKKIEKHKHLNVSCHVKQSIAACLEYGILIGNILKEFQENWHV